MDGLEPACGARLLALLSLLLLPQPLSPELLVPLALVALIWLLNASPGSTPPGFGLASHPDIIGTATSVTGSAVSRYYL